MLTTLRHWSEDGWPAVEANLSKMAARQSQKVTNYIQCVARASLPLATVGGGRLIETIFAACSCQMGARSRDGWHDVRGALGNVGIAVVPPKGALPTRWCCLEDPRAVRGQHA